MNLRPGLRQEAVVRYERVIAVAVAEFPRVVKHNPAPLASSTFAARLRDAMISLHTHNWELPLNIIDREKFHKVFHDLVVGDRDTYVITGAKETVLAPLDSAQHNEVPTGIVINNPTIEELSALCELCQNRRFPQSCLPIHLTGEVSEPILQQLESEFDVAFDKLPNFQGYHLI